MLVSENENNRNKTESGAIGLIGLVCVAGLASVSLGWAILMPLPFLLACLWRYRTARRYRARQRGITKEQTSILNREVSFYQTLDDDNKKRFRDLVAVFLDEVLITGIRTDVDETTRMLVAASAVIPILGFDDWEYSTLGEVLIYPSSFDTDYQSAEPGDRQILGMVGTNHLSGVMILSKPSLVAGFKNDRDKRNVGIHEFAHLVDKQDGQIDGLPPGVSEEIYRPWVRWVGDELTRQSAGGEHIDDYAYTNEAEYFAVLTEYFFESPSVLQKKAPHLYDLMQKMYRQNTTQLLGRRPRRRGRVGRNQPCPCGSGEKYKRCCLR